MDFRKLKADMGTDPCLKFTAFEAPEDLAQHLITMHQRLMSPDGGLMGYLYQQQTRRVRELQKELDDVRSRK